MVGKDLVGKNQVNVRRVNKIKASL